MTTRYDQYDGRPGILSPPPDPHRDHMQGSPHAPVQLVEYGDYQCPFCAAAHPTVKAVQKVMGDEMAFTYRHFPLVEIHPMAEPAAEAAEAAGSQGRFWPMHDQLFAHQQELDGRALLLCATAAGIPDLERFVTELTDHRHAVRVRDDLESGIRSGVNGTPTFFINGARHAGLPDLPSLLGAVQAEALRVPH
jgi:protein-disulfide isomerase